MKPTEFLEYLWPKELNISILRKAYEEQTNYRSRIWSLLGWNREVLNKYVEKGRDCLQLCLFCMWETGVRCHFLIGYWHWTRNKDGTWHLPKPDTFATRVCVAPYAQRVQSWLRSATLNLVQHYKTVERDKETSSTLSYCSISALTLTDSAPKVFSKLRALWSSRLGWTMDIVLSLLLPLFLLEFVFKTHY